MELRHILILAGWIILVGNLSAAYVVDTLANQDVKELGEIEQLQVALISTKFLLNQVRQNLSETTEELRLLKMSLQNRTQQSTSGRETDNRIGESESMHDTLMQLFITLTQTLERTEKNEEAIENLKNVLRHTNQSRTAKSFSIDDNDQPTIELSANDIDEKSEETAESDQETLAGNTNTTRRLDPTTLNQIIDDMISRPKARFYGNPDFTGDLEYFNPSGLENPRCINLAGKVGSVNYYDTCIRLYANKFCYGLSMALYSSPLTSTRSKTHNPPPMQISSARSVGRCFTNEFSYTEYDMDSNDVIKFKKTSRPFLNSQLQFIPDYSRIGYTSNSGESVRVTQSGPIIRYRLGHRGRVEFFHAGLRSRDIIDDGKPFPPSPSSVVRMNITRDMLMFHIGLQSHLQDRIGFLLSPFKFRIQKDPGFFTSYPQSNLNRQLMWEQEKRVLNYLEELPWVWVTINLEYQNETSSRPYGLSYRIGLDLFSFNTTDTYIPN